MLTAVALTGIATAAISGPLTQLYRVASDSSPERAAIAHEVVTFVATAPPPVRPLEPLVREPATRQLPSASERQPSHVDDADPRRGVSTPPSSATATHGDSSVRAAANAHRASGAASVAGGPGSPSPASFVVLPRSPFGRSATLAPAQRDSVLNQLSRAVPRLAAIRRPTQGERDTLWREEARRQAMWREQGRPVPIILGSGGVSLPLFSSGPSRQKRMRDSVVHRDNLLRLERLAARAQARRDTTHGIAERRGLASERPR